MALTPPSSEGTNPITAQAEELARKAAYKIYDRLEIKEPIPAPISDIISEAIAAAIARERALAKEMAEALDKSPCPYPVGNGDGTVHECIEQGNCGCENKPILSRAKDEWLIK